tara:strand:- start:307 stop:1644 length:1338 start_codon:yes stop_codon:yes gene_type:complete
MLKLNREGDLLDQTGLFNLYPKVVLERLRGIYDHVESLTKRTSEQDVQFLNSVTNASINEITALLSNLSGIHILTSNVNSFINANDPSLPKEEVDWEIEKFTKGVVRSATPGKFLPISCTQHKFHMSSASGFSFADQREIVLSLGEQDEQKYESKLLEIYRVISATRDDRNGRETAAYNSLSVILDHLGYFEYPPKVKKPLKVLQMLYGNSTYVCQALRNLGYDIEIVNLDINDFSDKQDISNYEHVTADARQAIKALKEKKFDIIIHNSAGTNLFYLDDMKKVLNDSYKLLKKNGICVFPVKGVFATTSIEHIKNIVEFKNGKLPLISNGWAENDRCIPYYDGFKQEIHNCIEPIFNDFCKMHNLEWLYDAQQENEKNSCYQAIKNLKYRPTLNPLTDLKIGKKINHKACVISTYKGTKGADKGLEYVRNINSFQTLNWFSFVK